MLDAQKELDQYIIRKKGLEGQDLVLNTLVALDVELAEMANESRWFKHWSEKRWKPKEGLLDEIADCMHFFFSLAIQKQWTDQLNLLAVNGNIVNAENASEIYATMKFSLLMSFKELNGQKDEAATFGVAWLYFIAFATDFCGYNTEDLENAYWQKHNVNIKRQKEGY